MGFIEDAIEFEKQWDKQLGGERSRELRFLIGVAVGRLVAISSVDSVDAYIGEVLAQMRRPDMPKLTLG